MARKSRDEAGEELARGLTTTSVAAPQGGLDFGSIEIEPPDFSGDDRQRTERAALVNGVTLPAPEPSPARVLPSGEMDFGELVHRLGNVIPAVKVRIGDVSQWSLVERLQARGFLEGSNAKPAFLEKFTDRRFAPAESAIVPPYYDVRTPDGFINNCSLANGESASSCQLCKGTCPDAARFVRLGYEEPAPQPPGILPPKMETDKHPPPLFATAHGKISGITPDFERIVEVTFPTRVFLDYDDLEKNLEVGEERGDYGTLRVHLDKAQARARRAHKLYLGAKLELAGWERDAMKVSSAMRGEAVAELEAEKAAGERKKAITNSDVEGRMSEKFTDEYASQELTRAKLKGVVEDMEHLVKCWNAKCGDLRTLLETLRR